MLNCKRPLNAGNMTAQRRVQYRLVCFSPRHVYWVTLVEMKYRAEATAPADIHLPYFYSVLPCRFQQLPIESVAADLLIAWGAAYYLFHARDFDLNRVVWDVAGSVRVLPSPVPIRLA